MENPIICVYTNQLKKVDKWVNLEVKGVTYKILITEIPYQSPVADRNEISESVSNPHQIHNEVSFVSRVLETGEGEGADHKKRVEIQSEYVNSKKESVTTNEREKGNQAFVDERESV